MWPRRGAPLLVLVVIAACGGGSRPPPVAIGSVPSTGGEEGGASAFAPPGGLRRALAAMPVDHEMVLAIDAEQLRASSLYRRHEPAVRAWLADELSWLARACDLDPLDKITGVLLGGTGVELEEATLFVRGLQRPAVDACMRAGAAQDRTARLSTDGDVVEYTSGDPAETARMLWIDDRTLLAIKRGGVTGTAEQLRAAARARDGAGLTGSAAFMDLLEGTRLEAPFWMVSRGDGGMFAAITGMLGAVALRVEAHADDGVRGELDLVMKGEDEARALAEEGQRQLRQLRASPLASIASDVAVRHDGREVTFVAAFSAEQLEQIFQLAGGFGGP